MTYVDVVGAVLSSFGVGLIAGIIYGKVLALIESFAY